jgi:hypothetical protein
LITGENDWIGKLTGDEWIATVHFNTAPHNAFQTVICEADYKYKSVLAHYGGMAAAARRPGRASSERKRIESNKFDLPEALGPMKNARISKATSTDRKLRQLVNLRRVNRSASTIRLSCLACRRCHRDYDL